MHGGRGKRNSFSIIDISAPRRASIPAGTGASATAAVADSTATGNQVTSASGDGAPPASTLAAAGAAVLSSAAPLEWKPPLGLSGVSTRLLFQPETLAPKT